MAEEEPTLFGEWGSPFSLRVETALKMKGISYKYIEEDLSNKSPLLLKYNPINKQIPVLLHNGKPIVESQIILEYIDETWKENPILPQDPLGRANARFWARYMDDKCVPAIWKACWAKGEEREKAKEEAIECLRTLGGALKDKKFFGGDKVGYVDIVGNYIAYWLKPIEEVFEIEFLTAETCPVLFKWSEEYVECAVIKENLAPRDRLVEWYKNYRQSSK